MSSGWLEIPNAKDKRQRRVNSIQHGVENVPVASRLEPHLISPEQDRRVEHVGEERGVVCHKNGRSMAGCLGFLLYVSNIRPLAST